MIQAFQALAVSASLLIGFDRLIMHLHGFKTNNPSATDRETERVVKGAYIAFFFWQFVCVGLIVIAFDMYRRILN